jgi:hypothetical protein
MLIHCRNHPSCTIISNITTLHCLFFDMQEVWYSSSQAQSTFFSGQRWNGDIDEERYGGEGTNFDLGWGFLMGLLLGVLMVFWFMDRSTTKKQKLGIIFGILVKVSACQYKHR